MTKHTLRTITIGIAVLALIGLGIFALNIRQQEDKKPGETVQTDNKNQQAAEVSTGRDIVLTKFGTTFALPERFDVTDIKIIYKTADKYEVAVVASKTLPEKLHKDQCWGGTLELGSFAEITRYASPGDMKDLQKVGNYYYRVDEGPALKNCYDAAVYNNYYAEDVVPAIRSTLQVR